MGLINLEGVSKEITESEFFTNCNEVIGILDKGIAATAITSFGAINIWVDDDGFVRCVTLRESKPVDKRIFKKEEMFWIAKWAGLALLEISRPELPNVTKVVTGDHVLLTWETNVGFFENDEPPNENYCPECMADVDDDTLLYNGGLCENCINEKGG